MPPELPLSRIAARRTSEFDVRRPKEVRSLLYPFRMTPYTIKQVLEVFSALPGHRGCTEADLDAIEQELNVTFPAFFRWIMTQDAQRLYNTGIFVPLSRLADRKADARRLLAEDGHEFRLAREHVVFAWDDIRAFQFFSATGGDDVPVCEFDYYSDPNDGRPTGVTDTLAEFYAARLQEYLRL